MVFDKDAVFLQLNKVFELLWKASHILASSCSADTNSKFGVHLWWVTIQRVRFKSDRTGLETSNYYYKVVATKCKIVLHHPLSMLLRARAL